jgi:hypothetical protein
VVSTLTRRPWRAARPLDEGLRYHPVRIVVGQRAPAWRFGDHTLKWITSRLPIGHGWS